MSRPASRNVSRAATSASGGARDRHVDGEHAGRHGGCGEDRVGERPVRVGVERLEVGVATEGGKPVAQMHRGAPLGVAAGRAPAELQERVELAREGRCVRARSPDRQYGGRG